MNETDTLIGKNGAEQVYSFKDFGWEEGQLVEKSIEKEKYFSSYLAQDSRLSLKYHL